MATLASDNVYPKIIASEQPADPAAPAAGTRKLYAKADGWYDEDSAGVVTGPFGAGGGGAGRVLVAKTTLTGAATSINFGSIPAGYEHLEVLLLGRSSAASSSSERIYLTFNGDTTDANYESKLFYGATSVGNESPAATRAVGFIIGSGIGNPTRPAISLIRLLGYADTTWHKTAFTELAEPITGGVAAGVGSLRWANTAAVTSLSLTIGTGSSFVTGTTAWLYATA